MVPNSSPKVTPGHQQENLYIYIIYKYIVYKSMSSMYIYLIGTVLGCTYDDQPHVTDEKMEVIYLRSHSCTEGRALKSGSLASDLCSSRLCYRIP